jgi:glycosyltransferase involved in cell wall biosynthesis
MCKVSVVITCYNKGKFISETLECVKKQSLKNFEIVIVDDCSTDPETLNVLKGLQNEEKTKVVFLKENVGVCEARNSGIKASGGKYILLLDGDDKISSEYLLNASEILDRDPEIKVVSCEVELFGRKKGRMQLPETTIENLLAQNTLVISSMFRRVDFDRTSGFNSNMKDGLEDWDFWLSLLKSGGKVYRLPEVHFYYRISKSSRNNFTSEKLRKFRKQIYLNHKELYSKHLLDPLLSFEYAMIRDSREYRIGSLLLKPLRKLQTLLNL